MCVRRYRITLFYFHIIQVNNVTVHLPSNPSPGINIEYSGQNILVMTDFNVWVTYDGWTRAEVGVPLEYMNHTVGLCGDFNGDPSNDLLLSDGNMTLDANDWGDSWNLDPRYVQGRGKWYLWST